MTTRSTSSPTASGFNVGDLVWVKRSPAHRAIVCPDPTPPEEIAARGGRWGGDFINVRWLTACVFATLVPAADMEPVPPLVLLAEQAP